MAETIVACAVWGDWPGSRIGWTQAHRNRGGDASMQGEYVRRLRNMVARNLTIPHRFVCVADDVSKVPEGIESLPLDIPWYSRGLPKAYVYGAPFTGCPLEGRILLFDLDTVIIGNIDDFVTHDETLVVRERYYKLPKIVPDGDLVYSLVGSDKARKCAELMQREIETEGRNSEKGDERVILGRAGATVWGRVLPGRVCSYKRHCRNGPPEGARIISFHGRPLPDQVDHEWVKEAWQ